MSAVIQDTDLYERLIALSKLVYDYIAGFHRENDDGTTVLENGRLPLFRNFDEHGNPPGRPRTLLIDSEQLESGEALDAGFHKMAAIAATSTGSSWTATGKPNSAAWPKLTPRCELT